MASDESTAGLRAWHHNTDAEVADYLRRALEIVTELDPPEDLRVPAFELAAGWLSSKTVIPPRMVAPALGLGH